MRSTRPGYPYHHFVYDNGSEDGTVAWLTDEYSQQRLHMMTLFPENRGLHVSLNQAHRDIGSYDLIMQLDNDVEFKTKGWLKKLVRAQRALGNGAMVSPRVKGLNNPPPAWASKHIGGFQFSFVDILGGICKLYPRHSIEGFQYNERKPMAVGGATDMAAWCQDKQIPQAYVEDVIVRHMDTTAGQEAAIPDYFSRKWYESYIPYGL